MCQFRSSLIHLLALSAYRALRVVRVLLHNQRKSQMTLRTVLLLCCMYSELSESTFSRLMICFALSRARSYVNNESHIFSYSLVVRAHCFVISLSFGPVRS
jgi:hypothetical protein